MVAERYKIPPLDMRYEPLLSSSVLSGHDQEIPSVCSGFLFSASFCLESFASRTCYYVTFREITMRDTRDNSLAVGTSIYENSMLSMKKE